MRKTITMPVVSALNTRVSGINALPATSGIVGVGVVGIMVVGQSASPSTSKDARFVNCFKHTAGGRTYCVKRPGLGVASTPQSGSIGTALLVWTGVSSKIITAFGSTNSSIYDSTTRLVTNNGDNTIITGKATSISETEVSNIPTLYIPSTDNTAWYYQNAGTVTKIADAQFPGNNGLTLAGFGAHLDGYTFQMDTLGQIWNSDLNSITSWTAAGYIPCTAYPDKGIGCVRWKEYIVGFGTESMQFFKNGGNPPPGSPLTLQKDMTQKIGAVSADAITSISDTIFFCGSTPQGGLSIYEYNGQISRASPPEIDALLLLAGAGGVKLTALRDLGLSFILVKAGSSQYAYCIEEKFWFVWSSDLGFVRFAGVSTGTSQVSYGVSELSTSGKLYTINPQSRVFTDDSVVWSASWRLPTIDPGNGKYVSYERLEIVADVESSTSFFKIVWSDDDYTTNPAPPKTFDLSQNIPFATRLGRTKKPRSFSGVHSANTPMRIEKLRLTIST